MLTISSSCSRLAEPAAGAVLFIIDTDHSLKHSSEAQSKNLTALRLRPLGIVRTWLYSRHKEEFKMNPTVRCALTASDCLGVER